MYLKQMYMFMIQCIKIGQMYPKKVPDEVFDKLVERLHKMINKGLKRIIND